ncbi:unnamed protein product [Paramecium primaurelia]|uniref:Uncharacterized protein n=1 Tax=Paramecium primaurelia TaxID=5886 RepID=A0A8S1NQ80_PARPR|nr:unnamed protein product [Paramecium primaurelia]
MDDNFKKLIESTQPESLSTIRLCKRLGYRPQDLTYKSIDEFQSVNNELRQVKYDHYKARVLKIVNEINNVRSRNKTTGLSELPSQTNVQFSSIVDTIEEQSQNISTKDRVLQNLIYQELLRQKKFAQYYQQNNKIQDRKTKLPTQSSKQITIQSKPSTQLLKTEQSNKRCETHREYENKDKFFITSNEKFLVKRQQILQQEEIQQEEYMQKLKEKEKKAIERIQQFKSELKQHFQKSNLEEVKNKKEQLDNEQYQMLITKQCEKLQKLRLKQSQLNKPFKQQIQIRNKTQSLVFDHDLQQKIDNKIERVVNLKSQLLSERQKIISEKLKINQDDVNFNKYHNEQLKIKEENKRIGKIQKNHKQNSYQIDLKHQLLEKYKKESVWEQVNRVSHLFSNPVEYDGYRTQMKLLLNKQRETLDPKYQNRIDILYQLLPSQMAEKVLQ